MQIFSLMGEILLKDNDTNKKLDDIDKKASKTDKSMGISFGNIVKSALKVGSIIGLGLGFKDIYDESMEGQKGMAQMNTVLKSTGGVAGMTKDALIKLAEAQGKLTQYDDDANIATENLLLTFTNIGKKTFPDALKSVNDMSQALGQDTKSSAIQLGKALNDPIKGITALSRVGVSFTEGQKKAIESMVKAGNTAGAQKIILQELQKEFGGSAEAAGKTLPGQLTILKNNFLNLGASILDKVLPYVQNFTAYINDHMPQIEKTVTDVFKNITDGFGFFIDGINGAGDPDALIGTYWRQIYKLGEVSKDVFTWLQNHLTLVKDAVIALTAVWLIQKGIVLAHNIALIAHNVQMGIKKGLDIFETAQIIALYVAEGIHNGIIWAGVTAQTALNLVMSMNPIGLVILAIAGLIAIGVILYNKSTTFRNFINALWDNIKKFGVGVGTTFVKIKNDVVGAFENIWNKVTGIANNIKKIWDNIWNFKLPHIPLPHFNITGKLSIAPPSIPKLNIDWYKNGTDFFGGGLAGINEAGGEIVNLPRGSQIIPHDLSEQMAKNKGNIKLTIEVPVFLDGKQIAKVIAEPLTEELEFLDKNKSIGNLGLTT
jgi:hypothetical protein